MGGERARDKEGKVIYTGKQQIVAYRRWCAMRDRIRNNTNKACYVGVEICERWDVFENFHEDMGDCPEGYSLERKNNKLGYNKFNCKWIPFKDQSLNQTSNINFHGVCLAVACRIAGVTASTVRARINKGMSVRDAILHRELTYRQKQIQEAFKEALGVEI